MNTTKISVVLTVIEEQTKAARREANNGNLAGVKVCAFAIEQLLKQAINYVNEAENLVKKEFYK